MNKKITILILFALLFTSFLSVNAEESLEISDIQVPTSSISPTTVTITWDTNFPSNSDVHYWSVDGSQENWNWDKIDDYTQTNHSIELKDLKAFTTYNFTVSSKRETDSAKTTSGQMSFTTTIDDGSDSLQITNIEVPTSSIRPTTATITWKTNFPSNSDVHYWSVDGSQENWNWDKIDDYTQTNHSIELKDLKPFTTYNFTVSSKRTSDYAKTTSEQMSFTTTFEGNTSNPVISNIQVPYQLIRTNKATVTWDTNVETDSLVYYAEVGSENWSWEGTDDLSASHSVEITNLKSFSTYKYYINSKDAQGKLTKSDNYEFTTTYDSGNSNDDETNKIKTNAYLLSNDKSDSILEELNELRNIVEEQNAKIKYLEGLLNEVSAITAKMEKAINSFITYGVDENTKKLGAGERAAVIYSYKEAYKKLPETGEDLADAIKIANGRWPSTTSDEAEKKAKEQFRKIYKRIADMDNPNDNAAITVMAYGLRQKAENRKLESEKSGINTFKGIYGHTPSTTEEWNIMQAITYSGAARQADTDKDYLPDSRELELGTDPNKSDSDGDGYLDGIEVESGFDPLKK